MKNVAMLALSLCAIAGTSAAGIVNYTDRSVFLNDAVGPLSTNDLNGLAVGTDFSAAPIDLGDVEFQLFGNTNATIQPGNASRNIDGTTHATLSTSTGNDLVFTFDVPIFAFGLDADALNDVVLRTQVELDGVPVGLSGPSGVGQGTQFLGAISDTAFTTVRFVGGIGDSWSFDNLVWGVPTPGPTGLVLVAGIAAARRRR